MMTKPTTSIFLAGLLAAFSLITFDLYQPSLSHIAQYFSVSLSTSQLTLSIYLFFFGISQLIVGPMIDHYGRRKLLPSSLLLAILASLICAVATNIDVLIFGRALQGVALCAAHLISLSISRDFEDSLERAKVLSYISMIISASPILAPVVGSLIFTYCGWQANFIVMALIAFVLMIQCKNGLKESAFWNQPLEPFNLKTVIQSYQAIQSSPILWFGSLIMMLSFGAVMLSIINSSYLIIDCLGYSPIGFGIIFIFNGLNIIFGNYLGIWLRHWMPMQATIYLGQVFIIIGGLAMLLVNTLYGFNLVALSFALVANLGISVSAPPTMSLMLTEFTHHTASAVAFMNTIRLFGSSLLAMAVGTLLAQSMNALPLGLIITGIAGVGCAYGFSYAQNKKFCTIVNLRA